jgi:hypothetical protein
LREDNRGWDLGLDNESAGRFLGIHFLAGIIILRFEGVTRRVSPLGS